MQEAARILRTAVAATSAALVVAIALPAADGAWRHGGRVDTTPPAAAPADERLERARATLAALEARRAALQRQAGRLGTATVAARRSLVVARRRLAERLRALYEAEAVDPLAAVLDAESLDDALARLDGIDRTARQEQDLIADARRLAHELETARRLLSRRLAEVAALEESARATLTALQALRADRAARAARAMAREPTARQPAGRAAQSAPAARRPAHRSTLTVIATAYTLRGPTATGMTPSYGVVAVDPAVIPLGSRLTIPGYGDGVAADTGASVRGARIDVWVPTVREALAWGTRSVTVTVHRA